MQMRALARCHGFAAGDLPPSGKRLNDGPVRPLARLLRIGDEHLGRRNGAEEGHPSHATALGCISAGVALLVGVPEEAVEDRKRGQGRHFVVPLFRVSKPRRPACFDHNISVYLPAKRSQLLRSPSDHTVDRSTPHRLTRNLILFAQTSLQPSATLALHSGQS
ncbi:hypothetical protein EYF80_001906 [Liparis tanakae]|uniref:Uncharacterized protein n=1 Tax=Liparis tanakae TaxID=230148 RepID=A0A4Z2JFA2_9TELE|nr:hypothetical protein EYF80_001906 [Liparis tanakae]